MPSAPGLRERKKSETRRAIADAALDLALRHGPGPEELERIVDRAFAALASGLPARPEPETAAADRRARKTGRPC